MNLSAAVQSALDDGLLPHGVLCKGDVYVVDSLLACKYKWESPLQVAHFDPTDLLLLL